MTNEKKNNYKTAFTRKKKYQENDESTDNKLIRTLNLFDLTLLTTGGTLGAGVYVLAGVVAKTFAGPAVVLSFILAAVVSSFAGLCYAEFAGRIPKAGSAYIYTYVAIGEFPAFIIGWNLIIEHIIGVASIGKATSNYIDSLLGYPQKQFMLKHFPIHVGFLGEFPDIMSFLCIMLITMLVAWGVRESSRVNNILTLLNLLTILTVVLTGCYFARISNWTIKKSDIPSGVNGGEGGFLPFGWSGVIAGAAKCFYGFIGFDSIASTGDETKNPKRNIPLALIISLICITSVYVSIAIVMTMMWPYYDQDSNAPLPVIYDNLGMSFIKYIISGGAIFALTTTLIGAIFPLPRILYAMSCDGLLFQILSNINNTTKTPFISSVICGLISGTLAVIFNLEQLIDMASIGTFQAYTIVCICVLLLRYKANNKMKNTIDLNNSNGSIIYRILIKWCNLLGIKTPNSDTQAVSRVYILVYVFAAFCLSSSLTSINVYESIRNYFVVVSVILAVMLIFIMCLLNRLPQADENMYFKVPCVPLIPCFSIFLNIYLMMTLDYKTWIRFFVWIILGLLIYWLYGFKHSLESSEKKEENEVSKF
ncbi:cationic amino acid transporter 2-like isoform X2 [Daktulosphaira vitifoliae]|uniref:cationic amino acid transporter 2-like isoform X2 n=1 Tax=Daktulosphaira vitifoliae TaxID=58002 RepID=UPI0021AA9A67|nr:cationic amino acid transporter 2-like isoform X2 [Daktulosphaira vitifoliae]